MKRTFTLVVLATLAAHAAAQSFMETEPNGAFATANVLTPLSAVNPYSLIGTPSLTANDVDYFRLRLTTGSILSLVTYPLVADATPDTLLGLFDSSSSHLLLAQNDDFDSSGGSAINYRVTTTADYFIGVTGSALTESVADGGFSGTHNQAGRYQLTIGVTPSPQAVPEPASMAALGFGALALIRRRRNGAKQ